MKNYMPIWYSNDGTKIACTEKIKVMEENILEIQQMSKDAVEDAVLMGIDAQQIKSYLIKIIRDL